MFPHHTRRTRLIAQLPDHLDAILVTNTLNVLYLTGFTGSNAAVLIDREQPAVIATDGRYLTQIAQEVPDLECLESRSVAPALIDRAARDGRQQLGIEANHVTVGLLAQLDRAAEGRVDLIPVGPVVEQLRAVKDEVELDALARACAITDQAFAEVTAQLAPGLTEREVAWLLRSAIRDHGGEDLAFDSIVAFGPNSAIPHHQPTDRALVAGDLVKLDFGARYAGYHADMTRTVVMGRAADWQREIHAVVAGVQADARAAVVVGALPRDLDSQARDAITVAGYDVAHGLGHGVGLAIHEEPFLVAGSAADRLADRVPVTIEPGVYLPGRGGVRIEDTVVVGVAGAVSLTTSSRDLIEIG